MYYDTIEAKLATPEFLPRALFERFNIEVLATTDSPLDSLADHEAIRDFGMEGTDCADVSAGSGGGSGSLPASRRILRSWAR